MIALRSVELVQVSSIRCNDGDGSHTGQLTIRVRRATSSVPGKPAHILSLYMLQNIDLVAGKAYYFELLVSSFNSNKMLSSFKFFNIFR